MMEFAYLVASFATQGIQAPVDSVVSPRPQPQVVRQSAHDFLTSSFRLRFPDREVLWTHLGPYHSANEPLIQLSRKVATQNELSVPSLPQLFAATRPPLLAEVADQQPAPRPETPAVAPIPTRAGTFPVLEQTLREDKQIGLSVADMELQQVLKIIAEQSGVSVVLASSDNPKITLQLSKMPLTDILRVIAALTKTRFLKVGQSYVVATEEVLKTSFPKEWAAQYPGTEKVEPVISTQTYVCQSVSAEQALRVLSTMFPETQLKVQLGPSPIVPSFGGSSGGGGGAVSSSGGGSGSGGGSTPGGAGGGGGVQSGVNRTAERTLILKGEQKIVDDAMALLAKIDKPRPQISVKVEIVDVQNDSLRDLGITWSASNAILTERTPSGINFESFTRNAQTFTGVISILEQQGKAKTLATPVIAMMDGQTGYVLIGQRINYPVVIGTTPNNTPIFDIKEERVGVYLQVGATVNDSGEITLNLYPQVSTITGFLNVQGASYPQVATREAQTTLRGKDGQTIILGGLIREQEIDNWDKVPFLSEIPILGELFKKRRTNRVSSQVIVSITPTIIK